ncbi:hypothetical protein Tco_0680315 [Tanacetum coccineum]|uniref:Tf2-1-like SH3-like domain-containing protein n=1 Tax=Tanacetum coccineum TaxID=301880 RepID=A0ABQ4XL52_9ASTR
MSFDPRLFAYVESPICILAFDSIFVCYPIQLFVTLEVCCTLSVEALCDCSDMELVVQRKFVMYVMSKVVGFVGGVEILRGSWAMLNKLPLAFSLVLIFVHDCTLRIEMGDALSRKERVKSRRVRGMILAAQSEAFKQENVLAERLHGLDQQMERKGDESLYFMDRIWVLLVGSVMDEAHASRQSKRMIQTLEDIMRACVINFGGSYHLSIQCAPFEALYGRKCRSPVLWAEIRESSLTGLELVQETTDKVVLVKEKPKATRDCQKSYVNYRRKPLEFEVGDRVLLKVTPWKGVVHFGKKGKLAPRYVGPFEILERIGLVAYRLRLPEELNSVHDTFHVSNLKRCLADANLHMPLDEIKVDKTLRFVEEPVEIMDREIKKLKRRKIAPVKVGGNSKRSPVHLGA